MVSASATAELSEEEGETAKGANRLSSCDIKEHADTRREQSQRAELISLLSQARDESAPGKSNEKISIGYIEVTSLYVNASRLMVL